MMLPHISLGPQEAQVFRNNHTDPRTPTRLPKSGTPSQAQSWVQLGTFPKTYEVSHIPEFLFFMIALCFFPSSFILALFLYSFFLCSSSISRIRCCNWAHQSVPLLLRTLGLVSTFVVFTCLKKATDSSLPLYLNSRPTHLE